MNSVLLHFSEWLQNTRWALAISGSTWAYPYVQLIHFTGLSLWVGTSVAVDLRLLGVGRRAAAADKPAAELSDALFFWNWFGFLIAVTGGFMLFATAASTFIVNPAFRLKVGVLLPLALIVHIVIQSQARAWDRAAVKPLVARIAGLGEILFWFAIATAAASIPYFEHI